MENKTTDVSSLKTMIEELISNHYSQLKSRVHFLTISCGNELSVPLLQLISISPSFGAFHPSVALLLSSSSQFQEVITFSSPSIRIHH